MRSLFGRRRPEEEVPLRGELLGLESLEERAKTLAGVFTLARDSRAGGHDIRTRLDANLRVLREAYRLLAGDVRRGDAVDPAAEWLLDNFHLVESEARAVRHDLPSRYYQKLPKLAARELSGKARIHAMALELIRHGDGRLDAERLTRFVLAYQTVAPLTIGELWAWPSMLKLALLENLRILAAGILSGRAARREADAALERLAGGGPPEPLPEPLHSAFVAQLRQRMRESDPRVSSLHARMEEASPRGRHDVRGRRPRRVPAPGHRPGLDRQHDHEPEALRHARLEPLRGAGQPGGADPAARSGGGLHAHGFPEPRPLPPGRGGARRAHRRGAGARRPARRRERAPGGGAEGDRREDRSRRPSPDRPGPAGPGDRRRVHPRLGQRLRRFAFSHATAAYLGGIGLLTGLGVYAAIEYVRASGAPEMATAAALLATIPASELAVLIVQRLVAALVPPRRLARLDLIEGVPESARTMVVVPTLLGSVKGVEALLEHLEVQALGNLDPHIHFAILGDFKDAPAQTMEGDAEILAAAAAGIEALNRRHAPDAKDRFFLFHRERRWNPKEGVFMGWERKRGKLEEFNRLLRDASDTGFTVRQGDLSILPSVRYVLTLDADSRLPRGAAQTLIGILSHPLNRPVFDPSVGRVTEGYGILQPRVSVTLASAAGSLFARVYAGHTGVDPYTTAVSDTYQDLFGEGVFTGKGLYDVDAFRAAVDGRVPENALLSHDLFEGLHARTALVSDVEVVDDYPANLLAHARRQHRWVRGDWQILALASAHGPDFEGLREEPPAAHQPVEDPRQPAAEPRGAVAPRSLRGRLDHPAREPARVDPGGLSVVSFPLVISLFHLLKRPPAHEPARVHLRGLLEELSTASAQAFLTLVFLPYHAWEMVHAIALTLVRLVITQRRLLDWETAAAQAARAAGLLRDGSPLVPGGDGREPDRRRRSRGSHRRGASRRAPPRRCRSRALWAIAPLLAYWLSQPAAPRRRELSPADRELLLAVARKTWRYFETLAGPEDHGLPPDNLQEEPARVVAHRTSPTNIGMGLLSTLAAHDLGFLPADAMLERLERTLTTVEGLERHEGHLLNWYDTRNLSPLLPRYVSTVDSGNLAGALARAGRGVPAAGRVATAARDPPPRPRPARRRPSPTE